MFYSVDGKIVKLENGFPQRKVNSLTFQVSGGTFPNYSFATNSNGFKFESSIEQSVTVNWGDGNVVSYLMKRENQYDDTYGIGWTQTGNESIFVENHELQPIHNYQDANTGDRFITFEFEDLTAITSFRTSYILLKGAFPVDLLSAKNLSTLVFTASKHLENLPDLSENTEIKQLTFSEIAQNKFNRIPDSFFNLNPISFRASNTFNLGDKIASNLFKINQWTNLEFLDLSNCGIKEFENGFSQNTEIRDLRLIGNDFTQFPVQIYTFSKMYRLYIEIAGTNVSFIDFVNLKKLESLWLRGDFNLSEIPQKWKGLVSFKSFSTFQNFISTNARFDEFINVFYTLCTNEANITEDSNAFGGEYPHRFRDISWGHSSLAFTGTKQAPQGYVQGVSNGTPANEGEKVYVLQNQYGHTITHA